MRRLVVLMFALAGAALIAAAPAIAATKVINVNLRGNQEVPRGSPSGSGTAKRTLNSTTARVCFNLTYSGIVAASASHIHKGPRGTAGNVVVVLFGNPPAKHAGCVTASKSLVADIERNPGAYYVNIHTARYPGGAIRAQL